MAASKTIGKIQVSSRNIENCKFDYEVDTLITPALMH